MQGLCSSSQGRSPVDGVSESARLWLKDAMKSGRSNVVRFRAMKTQAHMLDVYLSCILQKEQQEFYLSLIFSASLLCRTWKQERRSKYVLYSILLLILSFFFFFPPYPFSQLVNVKLKLNIQKHWYLFNYLIFHSHLTSSLFRFWVKVVLIFFGFVIPLPSQSFFPFFFKKEKVWNCLQNDPLSLSRFSKLVRSRYFITFRK
jgi:hypothetical protein